MAHFVVFTTLQQQEAAASGYVPMVSLRQAEIAERAYAVASAMLCLLLTPRPILMIVLTLDRDLMQGLSPQPYGLI